ncbi:MAG: hypothetical protein OEV81_16690 [Betaproteobacteria bacterium]|nr:hypothetical protein [Betaproteobacteria bacterium]
MRRIAFLLLAALLLPQGTALAQERERQGLQRQEMQPRERNQRESLSRERAERHQPQREHRFTREERDKLRQDLMDANREMRGRRGGRQ